MADETKPQEGESVIDPTTSEGQEPEAQQAASEAADPRVTKANREAAAYRTKLRAVEAELAKIKSADEARKVAELTDAERAKKEAADARAEAERARAEVAEAKAQASIARSGVLEKYERVMTSDLIRAQSDDPSIDIAEWIKSYKEGHAELFGAARPAEPTGAGGPPPGKTGSRNEKIAQLEKELEHWSSPLMRDRRGADIRRVGISRELAALRGQ